MRFRKLQEARGRGNQGDWMPRKNPGVPDTEKNRALRAEQDRHNAEVEAKRKARKA